MQKIREEGLAEVRQLLGANQRRIGALLGDYMPVERFAGSILVLCQHNPDLLPHNVNPQSLVLAVLRVAQLRLSPDPALGQVWIIPRKGRAEFQLGYKGRIALAYRSPMVSAIRYGVVADGDGFTWEDGREWKLVHRPSPRGWPQSMDEIIAAWAILELKSGGTIPRVMYRAEILAHKSRGSGSQPAWSTDPAPMAAKTVLADVTNRGPFEGEIARAFALDTAGELGLGQLAADEIEPVATGGAAAAAAAAIVGSARTAAASRAQGPPPPPPVEQQQNDAPPPEQPAPEAREEVSADAPTEGAPAAGPGQVGNTPGSAGTGAPPPIEGSAEEMRELAGAAREMIRRYTDEIPGVGPGVALNLYRAGFVGPDEILAATPGEIAKRVDGCGRLRADQIRAWAQKNVAFGPPDGAIAADGLFPPEEAAPPATEPGPPPPATEPELPQAADLRQMRIRFKARRTDLPWGQDSIDNGNLFSLERMSKATKTRGLETVRAWVKASFGFDLEQLPRYLYGAAYDYAAAGGDNPDPTTNKQLMQKVAEGWVELL